MRDCIVTTTAGTNFGDFYLVYPLNHQIWLAGSPLQVYKIENCFWAGQVLGTLQFSCHDFRALDHIRATVVTVALAQISF